MKDSGRPGQPASIRSYTDKLMEINDLYTACNGGVPIPDETIRCKVLQLTRPAYSMAIEFLEQDDVQAEAMGRKRKTVREIINWLLAYEIRNARRLDLESLSGKQRAY